MRWGQGGRNPEGGREALRLTAPENPDVPQPEGAREASASGPREGWHPGGAAGRWGEGRKEQGRNNPLSSPSTLCLAQAPIV